MKDRTNKNRAKAKAEKHYPAYVAVQEGKAGLTMTWQEPFPEAVKCEKCGAECRHALTLIENRQLIKRMSPVHDFVCRLHDNDPKGAWPHDAIAVALYFCRKCYHGQVEWNQA